MTERSKSTCILSSSSWLRQLPRWRVLPPWRHRGRHRDEPSLEDCPPPSLQHTQLQSALHRWDQGYTNIAQAFRFGCLVNALFTASLLGNHESCMQLLWFWGIYLHWRQLNKNLCIKSICNLWQLNSILTYLMLLFCLRFNCSIQHHHNLSTNIKLLSCLSSSCFAVRQRMTRLFICHSALNVGGYLHAAYKLWKRFCLSNDFTMWSWIEKSRFAKSCNPNVFWNVHENCRIFL